MADLAEQALLLRRQRTMGQDGREEGAAATFRARVLPNAGLEVAGCPGWAELDLENPVLQAGFRPLMATEVYFENPRNSKLAPLSALWVLRRHQGGEQTTERLLVGGFEGEVEEGKAAKSAKFEFASSPSFGGLFFELPPGVPPTAWRRARGPRTTTGSSEKQTGAEKPKTRVV